MSFAFGDYRLDPDLRELTRGAESVALAPQVFDLLLYLLRNRAHVVSKDDLFDAVWAGRIVSESTLTSHINAVRKAVGDSGEEQRLIRTIPRKGFRFVGEVTETGAPNDTPTETAAPSLRLPDKPSIAVLPFLNLSGDPAQDYFADGMVEEIILALSRLRWLFVVARNSSFTYKGRAVDATEIGRALGVRYLLEGSVRKSGNRIRITGQLIDATSGAHLWAERFEGTLDDIFALQDHIAASVVGAIAPELERAERERARLKPTDSLDAYDYYLRGMTHFHSGSKEGADAALQHFYQAIERDAAFAAAYGMAAWCIFWRKINGWMVDRAPEMAEGGRLAQRAVELSNNDAVALTRGGHALAHFRGDFDGAIALLDKALTLNPNLAAAWYLGGFLRVAQGEPEDAIQFFTHAMRLSPLDPEMMRMQAGTALAHLLAGRADDASRWAEMALRELPDFLLANGILACAQALANRHDAAGKTMQHLRRLDPDLRISNLRDWITLHRASDWERFTNGLRRAGLPE